MKVHTLSTHALIVSSGRPTGFGKFGIGGDGDSLSRNGRIYEERESARSST
jgi:hypothetical protein